MGKIDLVFLSECVSNAMAGSAITKTTAILAVAKNTESSADLF